MVPVLAFLGGMELVVVAGIFLLLFGSRLPSVMKSLGQSVTSFKSGLNDTTDQSPDENLDNKKR